MNRKGPSERPGLRRAGKPTESERRDRRRLREVLGVNAAGIEVILRLRQQIMTLQTRVHQLEVELAGWEAGQNIRLARHRDACVEAAWQEVVKPEGRR